jgi:hypothetical protein
MGNKTEARKAALEAGLEFKKKFCLFYWVDKKVMRNFQNF